MQNINLLRVKQVRMTSLNAQEIQEQLVSLREDARNRSPGELSRVENVAQEFFQVKIFHIGICCISRYLHPHLSSMFLATRRSSTLLLALESSLLCCKLGDFLTLTHWMETFPL